MRKEIKVLNYNFHEMNKDKRIVYDLDTSVGMYSNFELDQLAAIAEYEINEIKHIKDRKLNN